MDHTCVSLNVEVLKLLYLATWPGNAGITFGTRAKEGRGGSKYGSAHTNVFQTAPD
jgi:hypothetical protein